MKTKILTTLIMIGTPFYVTANNPYNDFLLAAETDLNAGVYNGSSTPDMNALGSWVEDAQFRFNTGSPANDIDIKKDALTYEIRVKPKAWGQRKIEENIINLRVNQQDIAYNQLLNSALQKRYLKLLDYFEKHHRLRYLLKTSELLSQETGLIQSQITSAQFNPEKLLDTEESLKQTQGMIRLNLSRLNAIQSEQGFPLDSIDSLKNNADIDWVVNVSEIHNITSSSKEEDQSPPEIINARLKLKLAQSENQLIKAKQQLGINLVKFEYGDRKNDEVAFQVGINIPLGNSFNDTENHYNLHVAESQLHTNTIITKQSLAEISREITWLSEDWKLIQTQIKREQKHLQKEYAKTNPFLMINLRKALISNQQKSASINQKALALYVKYLALSGQLTQKPLRNWIQHGTPELLHSKAY